MTINIKQFLQTFIDESTEMLQEMEGELLKIKAEKIDKESINKIFRVAHSIKSSSNIFNFKIMSALSHTVENYLDQVRENIKKLNKEEIEYLFSYVDCMRTMLLNIENNLPINEDAANKLNEFFRKLLKTPKDNDNFSNNYQSEKTIKENSFKILYYPNRQCFLQGQEPFRILNALAELGHLTVEIDMSDLPLFPMLDPTQCYLKWNLRLNGNIEKKSIEEVLAWTLDDDREIISIIDDEQGSEENPKNADTKISEFNPSSSKSIRVATDKIDNLMNIAGEFVILQSMLNQINKAFDKKQTENLIETIDKLEQNSLRLQDALLRVRMIPIEFAFTRFPRMVHDLAKQMGKEVELTLTGEKTELDRTIIEKIIDPLSHLIRNAIDHGIEMPAIRKKSGKNPVGHIKINSYQESGCVVIDIIDDGAGLNFEKIRQYAIQQGLKSESDKIDNDEIIKILSHPGFSTADSVTEISGRGVGMDVVYKNLSDIGGKLTVETKSGEGTKFQMRLPLTLAIMECQLIKVSNETYVIPLISFSEIIKIDMNELLLLDGMECYKLRDNYIKIIRLSKFFTKNSQKNSLKNKYLLIINDENKKSALCCDEVLWQQQVVIKSIEKNYQKINGITGATILGDGNPALVLDVQTIANFKNSEKIDLEQKINLSAQNISLNPAKLDNKFLDILSFLIAGREYGVDIHVVKEISICSSITPLPNVPSYVKGIINLRGMIIPVIDILECFSLGEITKDNKDHPIITVNIYSDNHIKTAGIIVDSVADTYHILSSHINKIPDDEEFEFKSYIQGLITINNKNIPILNMGHFIF